MQNILSIQSLSKTYQSGYQALKEINLEIQRGEIFALLGPNGAGKTTLINIICGIVNPSNGKVLVDEKDIIKDYKQARFLIGLVPQELTTDAFETVWNAVTFSRGLYGKPKDPVFVEKIIRQLSLWDKKDNKIMTLSGGMKRRLMIAKALSHEPKVLFLDEPTAGVDVSLRQDMWNLVKELKASGVTIILTTHYIEEAEEMADRIGIITKGKIILVDEKKSLISKLGKKELILDLHSPLGEIPKSLDKHHLVLAQDKMSITYTYDKNNKTTDIAELLKEISNQGIQFKDLNTKQSSLEEIFISLVDSDKQS